MIPGLSLPYWFITGLLPIVSYTHTVAAHSAQREGRGPDLLVHHLVVTDRAQQWTRLVDGCFLVVSDRVPLTKMLLLPKDPIGYHVVITWLSHGYHRYR